MNAPQPFMEPHAADIFSCLWVDFGVCKTEAHANGDARSRLPLPETTAQNLPELILKLMDHLKEPPVTYVLISSWTWHDPVLYAVLYITQAVKQGWPVQCPRIIYKLAPFAKNKLELSVHGGCVLWSSRVVVPTQGWKAILLQVARTPPRQVQKEGPVQGVCAVAWARQRHWKTGENLPWMSILPACTTSSPWKWSTRPRCHLHLGGPIEGKMFLY